MAIFIAGDGPLSAMGLTRPHNAAERFHCEAYVRRSGIARHASAKIAMRDTVGWRAFVFRGLEIACSRRLPSPCDGHQLE
jgi:hypothetical protein